MNETTSEQPAPGSGAGPSAGKGIAVALSGGGHRACLFALGALMYLVDAGKGPSISSVSSVSGGSLANGAVAQAVDLNRLSPGELDPVAARVAAQITGRGTLFGSAVTHAYLGSLALLALFALVCPWFLPAPLYLRILLFLLGLVLVGWAAGLRGHVCAIAFDRTLFRPGGSSTRLRSIHQTVDHVFCATDLHAGEHVYFSGGFVCCYRFGHGVPGDLKLSRAVQASAAFPGAFPATWLPTARHRFEDGAQAEAATVRRMALVDGGVYDNMADQWSEDLVERSFLDPRMASRFRGADQQVVVNSSAGLDWSPLRGLRLPLLGELLTLLRDKSVLYDNGNSLRRKYLVARFRQARRNGSGMQGALVHIPQSPFKVPKAFARGPDEAAVRARAVLAKLTEGGDPAATEARWAEIARANASVATTLVGLDAPTAARLLHHGYVLAMVNLHVGLGYPLLAMPDEERFAAIARGSAGGP